MSGQPSPLSRSEREQAEWVVRSDGRLMLRMALAMLDLLADEAMAAALAERDFVHGQDVVAALRAQCRAAIGPSQPETSSGAGW